MECKQCGYTLKQDDDYCPNCGKEVKMKGVECHHCHYIMEEDCNFCPKCGKEVVKDNNCCAQCGYKMAEEDVFCPNCGLENKDTVVEQKAIIETSPVVETSGYVPIQKTNTSYVKEDTTAYVPIQKTNTPYVKEATTAYVSDLKEETTDMNQPKETKGVKQENKDSFWRNPILWIISISLLLICLLLSQYMKDNPSSSKKEPNVKDKVTEELKDIGIKKDTPNAIVQSNNNMGGTTYRYGDAIYISVDGAIYEMDLEFGNAKKVVDEAGIYIYVDTTYIYYCDSDYAYQRVNRETKDKEKVLENIYYARVIDGMLYYQADGDGESIHVYNLLTKEDRKINNEKSYSMFVDTKNNDIYYLNGSNAIYKVNIDGTGGEVVVDDYITSFVYEEGIIYYNNAESIKSFDVTTKKDTLLLEDAGQVTVSLLEDKIVYGGYSVGLYTMNKDGNKKKVITTNYIRWFEVHGNVVIYSDASKGAIYGADKNANRTRIHKIKYEDSYDDYEEDSSPNIDGIQEF